jgi:Cu/Ag efflux protein CusF
MICEARWLSRRSRARAALALVSLLAAFPHTIVAGGGLRGAFEGEGRVLAVNEAKSTVTLDHGPIPGLMPPMRMRFTVENRDQLRALVVGDTVRFSLGSRGHEMVIVSIERLAPSGLDRRRSPRPPPRSPPRTSYQSILLRSPA